MPKSKTTNVKPPPQESLVTAKPPPKHSASLNQSSDAEEEGSLDIAACCICQIALDYSDKAAFFSEDRHEDYDANDKDDDSDDFFFRPSDPYLPSQWYDPNNALVYCDSCNRLYHQQCHFVPMPILPRGTFECLYCASQKKGEHSHHSKKTTSNTLGDFFARLSADPTVSVDSLFGSPPVPAARSYEQAWLLASASLQASVASQLLRKKLPAACQSQLATYRLAVSTLDTWTGTAQNRKHLSAKSQELADTLVKHAHARNKIRSWLVALESVRNSVQAAVNKQQLWAWCVEYQKNHDNDDFVERVIFPFGMNVQGLTAPRTPEFAQALQQKTAAIPSEITLSPHSQPQHKHKPSDDDSGISLDDLTCCVCHTSQATDDNDLILCDGQDCFRAYHMKCIKPVLSQADLEHDDWFCPLCAGLADLLHTVQCEYMGDDWEQRRFAVQLDDDASMTDSLKSWAHVQQVFAEAGQEYEAALELRDGKRTNATDHLLAKVLGWDAIPEQDDDNVEEDGHFDLGSFQEQREQERHDNDDSTHSSQATLVEMSSVELEIDKAELAALSDNDNSDESDDEDSGAGNIRRSRRLRKQDDGSSDKDLGKLDESNIISSKRGRKPVDYVQLNQAIFGDLSDGEVAKLDDGDDFDQPIRSRRSSESDSEEESSSNDNNNSTNSSESENDNDDDDVDGSGDEDSAPAKKSAKLKNGVKAPTKQKAKKRPSVASAASEASGGQASDGPSSKQGGGPSKGTKHKRDDEASDQEAALTEPQQNKRRKAQPAEEEDQPNAAHGNGSRSTRRPPSIAQSAFEFVSSLVGSPRARKK